MLDEAADKIDLLGFGGVNGMTLQGGGHLVLTDDANSLIIGGSAVATFVNVDNTISGAGQLGGGLMTLANSGTIIADGTHVLEINTGATAISNSGLLEATGGGGLVIDSALSNSGSIWANGGNIILHGDVAGGGPIIDQFGFEWLRIVGTRVVDALENRAELEMGTHTAQIHADKTIRRPQCLPRICEGPASVTLRGSGG